jgi:hypothetical protein
MVFGFNPWRNGQNGSLRGLHSDLMVWKKVPTTCHFEQSARPGASLHISCQDSNPGLGQGEIFPMNHTEKIRFLPAVEMTYSLNPTSCEFTQI